MAYIGIQLSQQGFYHQQSFRGVCDFARQHCPDWRFRFLDPAHKISESKNLDGLVVASRQVEMSVILHGSGLPIVNLSTQFLDPHLVQVWLDDVEIGRIAAAHLHQRGFRRWAYIGFDDHLGSRRRKEGYLKGILELGYTPDDLVMDIGDWQDATAQPKVVARLAQALDYDPRPIGCFAFDDALGSAVLGMCPEFGIEVPKRLGLIGAGNDDYLCETSFPTMSSIDIGHRARGFEAARVLAKMIEGQPLQTPLPPITPVGLVVRESTGPAATNDPLVDKAIAFIHLNARKEVYVEDILKHVHTSRRTLERRFRSVMSWSPHQHILYAKIEEVKQMLLTTDLDLESIARATGFPSRTYLSKVFRKMTDMTPMTFRGRGRK
ncbi:MAG: helix-turn-helix domain-containing protein [Phycisphaera sp.]|nr:helix-turn-helix domain-containing protein [Phycisphaera sp.]